MDMPKHYYTMVLVISMILVVCYVKLDNVSDLDTSDQRRRLEVGIISEDPKYNEHCWVSENKEYDPESKKGFKLERFAKHLNHGDVCRDPVTQNFFCPRGCRALKRAPYCVLKERGAAAITCRVNLTQTSRGEGTSSNGGDVKEPLAGSRITVKRLPTAAEEEDIKELFSSLGEIISVSLKLNLDGTSTGIATINYVGQGDGAKAAEYFADRTIQGVSLDITVETFLQQSPSSLSTNPIPVFASPIMMFNPDTGLPYVNGEAPSIWSLLFPSLTSARWVDPIIDIYIITNFVPHAKDLAELQRLKIKILDMTECFNYGRVKSMHESFQKSCPISGKDLGGSGIIGVTRFFALQGAMEMLGLDMVFFLEGDNLLLRSTAFLAEAYTIRDNKIDATITHISFHASFIGLEFVHQLNKQATLFAEYTKNHINHQCFLTGGGQDMRLGFEGAKMLQVERYLKAGNTSSSAQDGLRHNARILNTAGGTVPCDLKPRRWINALGEYCKMSRETAGPCALEPNLVVFNQHNGEMWSTEEDAYEPLLYECDPKSIRKPKNSQSLDEIPGSLQQNLKGRNVKQSPGKCSAKDSAFCQGTYTDNVKISKTFYCNEEWITHGPKDQYNKALAFKLGRAYSRTSSGNWVEQYNLHFQGGGCKQQMETVFTALKRSAGGIDELSINGFTCEGTDDLVQHEACMRDGSNARPALTDA